MTTFADSGIDIPSGATGEVYLTCPQCSADRRKKTAKCLGVNVEKGTWICNHCKWTGGLSNGRKNEPDAVYDYHDAAGKLLFQVVRFPGKQFRQRRPNGSGWHWKLGDVQRVPYRLPELLKSFGDVYICEGERDVETLRSKGFTATCNPGGAGKWRDSYGPHFKGRGVVVFADNDEVGENHACDVAAKLKGIAASIKIVTFTELPKGGDVSDYILKHGIEGLKERVGNIPAREESTTFPGNGKAELTGLSDLEFGDRTEIALTEALVAMYPDVRYVSHWHRWYLWDGRVWPKDTTTAMYDRIRGICREAAKGVNSESVARVLKKSQTIAGIERIARSDRQYAATVDQWDQDPMLLNTPSGVVNLETGDVKDHFPDYHMTKMTVAGPGDGCRRWLEFLKTVMGGDQALIDYLQRYFGYCLTGVTTEHVFQFHYGTGRNGKGVFQNSLRGLMGTYAMSTGMETFTEAYGDRHPTELASLVGARLVTAEEVEEGRRWAENRIKQMTGGTPVSARFMRQDFFEYMPNFKLMIAGNHKPALRDVDPAIRDRIQIVPFRVYIEPEKRDKGLEDKLRDEWPGILSWGIQGCLEWQDIGLAPPEAVRTETQAYFDTQDIFGTWLDECCVTDPKSWEPPSRLFASWREYAKESNTKSGTQSGFIDRLEARGFHQIHERTRRRWIGIKLKNDPGR